MRGSSGSFFAAVAEDPILRCGGAPPTRRTDTGFSEAPNMSLAERINSHPEPTSPAAIHPLGSRAKVLLTSVFGPYAQDDEYGSRAITRWSCITTR